MNYFPNRDDAYRMMPGPAGQPALRGMMPDLSDIGRREPPSAAIFGAISLVHEAAAISASAAYLSPSPIAAAIMARAVRVAARAITDRPRRAYPARSDAARPLRENSTRMSGRECSQPVASAAISRAGTFAGVKGIPLHRSEQTSRQAAFTS
jgi:hypothetical protein